MPPSLAPSTLIKPLAKPAFPIASVRAQFPALTRAAPFIYFDNAATSWPKPPVVAERMSAFLASEAAGNPSGRNITHDDYTGLVAFLAGPEASMIQGQVIFVNGGQYIIA